MKEASVAEMYSCPIWTNNKIAYISLQKIRVPLFGFTETLATQMELMI